MFNTDRFIEDCRSALTEYNAHAAAKEIVARAVSEPSQVLKALGEPKLAAIQTLYRSDEPNDPQRFVGAVHAFVSAQPSDVGGHRHLRRTRRNTFYRRGENGLIALGAKTLDAKEVIPLGDAVIHSVTNPLEQITGAIHVYGRYFFATPRSEWDPETFEERPDDVAHAMQVFEESNARLRAPERAK